MSAPYEPGQLVTVNDRRHCCPVCGTADMRLVKASSDESGVFDCRDCDEPFIRRYADVTPVPPPCPVEWCIASHGQITAADLVGIYHFSNNFARAADAYVVIVRHPGEAAAFNLSDYGDDAPILTVDVATAQMLARLAKRPVAAALRKAIAELDRITSGGDS